MSETVLTTATNRDDGDGGLDFTRGTVLGRVMRVDTASVEFELATPEAAARVSVSDLVAMPTRGEAVAVGLVDLIWDPTAAEGADRVDDGAAAGPPRMRVRAMVVGTLDDPDRTGRRAFRRGVGAYPSVGSTCYLIDGVRLRRFMAVLGADVPADERLLLGHFVADQEAAAIADGNRLFQRHAAILGSTGAGKSWAVALMLERAARLKHANLIVFDMHGEYAPLSEGDADVPPIAQRLRIAGPGDLVAQRDDALFVPYWMLDRGELLSMILDPSDQNATDQAMRFGQHVQKLKEVTLRDAGVEDTANRFTADSPVPYRLENLVSWLERDDLEKIPQHPSGRLEPGPYYGRLTGLLARLEARIADPRYGFIFSPPASTLEYDWLPSIVTSLMEAGPGAHGIKVIDFSEVPTAVIPLVAAVLARLLYNVQFWTDPDARRPFCFVCDEAHLYIPSPEESSSVHAPALSAFEAIAREGRKHGIALLVISQRPSDVSRTVLSQCSNFVVMRLTNERDQEVVERLMPQSLAGVTGVLPLLEVGEAVVLGDALLLPTRVKFDSPALQPASATQPFWTEWATMPSNPNAIADGVESLRSQLRGGRTVAAFDGRSESATGWDRSD